MENWFWIPLRCCGDRIYEPCPACIRVKAFSRRSWREPKNESPPNDPKLRFYFTSKLIALPAMIFHPAGGFWETMTLVASGVAGIGATGGVCAGVVDGKGVT